MFIMKIYNALKEDCITSVYLYRYKKKTANAYLLAICGFSL